MAKGITTSFVVHTLVRDRDRFLLVKERKNGLWYLPGGRVEAGENLYETARRETLEESGLPVVLEGLLRFEHLPTRYGARLRLFFLAAPEIHITPKRTPDRESAGADWFDLDQIEDLPLRGPEAEELVRYVLAGAPVFPMDLCQVPGAPQPFIGVGS